MKLSFYHSLNFNGNFFLCEHPNLDDLGSVIGRPGFGLIGPGSSDLVNGNFTSTSTSISITTNEDGSIQERRTTRTIGPDGVPTEETTVRNLGTEIHSLPYESALPIQRFSTILLL